jgi:hypothetical protein
MAILERLLPREASNDYRGSRVALYAFPLILTVMLGRGLIHFFKGDSGVNSIATIHVFTGDPDPNRVIYMFSALWGSQQLIMVMVYGIVLLRYRNLLPLMYVILIVEVGFRLIVGSIHPLGDEYYARTPPGKFGNLPLFAVATVMLFLSLRRTRAEPSAQC